MTSPLLTPWLLLILMAPVFCSSATFAQSLFSYKIDLPPMVFSCSEKRSRLEAKKMTRYQNLVSKCAE
ncbi:hypothetical protein T11_2032 [Trichinella zimbabwensis]|uniref:Secreted protein n=1 Tax=Trichinella zimbabwensis TaxID=268475 RepID=A0A0V1GM32_9BILA|nr:hypothetical protein T11_2032 [Trichinella zimbabwensis]